MLTTKQTNSLSSTVNDSNTVTGVGGTSEAVLRNNDHPKSTSIKGTRFVRSMPSDHLLPVRDSALDLTAPVREAVGRARNWPPLSAAAGIASATLSAQPTDPYSHDLTVNSFADFIVKSKNSGPGGAGGRSRFPYIVGPKRLRRRLVCKNGECNVSHKHIQKVRRQFLADIYTSLVDLKWRYILLICVTAFVSSWLFFGALWFVICYAHGDFEEDLATANKQQPRQPCVLEVHGFTTALLYSIETQHTIGYGGRQLTDACPEAVVLLMIQSLFGMIMQALMTGMMFAKLARPKKRAETLMFSRNAVVCKRDGSLCLMIRIGDMRRSHLVGANVRALMIRRRVSEEGEVLPLDSASVSLGLSDGEDGGEDRLMIIWPIIVLHRIDEKSPFWKMSRQDFESENFELIVILEGVIESTGMTTQARTSYLPGEILWGRRLERLITFQKEDGRYQVDYSRFHSTVPVDTPNCSAMQLREMEQRTAEEMPTLQLADCKRVIAPPPAAEGSEDEDKILLIPDTEDDGEDMSSS